MKTNVAAGIILPRTHEGGVGERQSALTELTRAVSTCLLWENTFYETGGDLAARIADLCAEVMPDELAALAIRARTDLKLRHVPLFLCRQLARLHNRDRLVSQTLAAVIQRPDELTEFLALYWKDKRQPLSAQVKKGLALAFRKFSEYQLAKWNRAEAIKLRDVLFLCHAKPKDAEQVALWKRLVDGTLATPDTWEVALSTGQDKKLTWERLLREKQLGYMALLMNLRNMTEAKVDADLVSDALLAGASTSRALPFRFLSAAKHAPQYAAVLSDAMVRAIGELKVPGVTALVIDVSGSMDAAISRKSTLVRWEAAGALGILFREACPACRVFTFSNSLVEVGNYRGIPLIHAIAQSQPHQGTHLGDALMALKPAMPTLDRLIVITDEQAHDGLVSAWAPRAYLVNVASYKPGLQTSGGWTRVNGWSERLVEWMLAEEDIPAVRLAEAEV